MLLVRERSMENENNDESRFNDKKHSSTGIINLLIFRSFHQRFLGSEQLPKYLKQQ